jgi:hypothetical protein
VIYAVFRIERPATARTDGAGLARQGSPPAELSENPDFSAWNRLNLAAGLRR